METAALRPRRRFTVEDYHRMGEAGILGPEDRVELIEGEIVEMSPIGSPHGGTVKAINSLLSQALGQRAIVSAQDPVVLSEISEPQPDIALLRPRADFYREAHPRPSDVLLLIEVSDTTLAYDRSRKLPVYARAGIAEYWIVNLPDAVIETYRSPSGDGYREKVESRSGELLASETFPDVPLDVAAILGTDRPA